MNSAFSLRSLLLLLIIAGPQLGCDSWSRTLQAAALLNTVPARTDALGWNNQLEEALPEDFFPRESTRIESGLMEFNGLSQDVAETSVLQATVSLLASSETHTLCESSTSPGYFSSPPPPEPAEEAEEAETAAPFDPFNPFDTPSPSPERCSLDPVLINPQTRYQLIIDWKSSRYRLYLPAIPQENEPLLTLSPAPLLRAGPSGTDLLHHPRGGDLTLEWTSPAPHPEPPPLIRVERLLGLSPDSEGLPSSPVAFESDPANPIYLSAPFPASSFATSVTEHILTPAQNSRVLRGAEVFNVSGLYMLAFTPLHLSTHTSENLHLGSGSLTGRTQLIFFRVE